MGRWTIRGIPLGPPGVRPAYRAAWRACRSLPLLLRPVSGLWPLPILVIWLGPSVCWNVPLSWGKSTFLRMIRMFCALLNNSRSYCLRMTIRLRLGGCSRMRTRLGCGGLVTPMR